MLVVGSTSSPAGTLRRRARPDRSERLYTLSRRHARDARQDRRADHPAVLLFARGSATRSRPMASTPSGCARCSTSTSLRPHGKIRLEVYDPQPFSDDEDRAVAFGLQGVPLDAQGEQVYFGLAGTNSTDDQQVIAVLRAGARALSRIRSDPAGAHARGAEEDRGRADQRAAARRRHDGGDAGPAGPADRRSSSSCASSTRCSTLAASSTRSRPTSTC